MDRKSVAYAIRALVPIALVAAVIAPSLRGHDADGITGPEQMGREQAASEPIILAQGRCFNGRCF